MHRDDASSLDWLGHWPCGEFSRLAHSYRPLRPFALHFFRPHALSRSFPIPRVLHARHSAETVRNVPDQAY